MPSSLSYREIFPTLFYERLESVNRDMSNFRSAHYDPQSLIGKLGSLSWAFESLAVGEYIVNSDTTKCKQDFYISAKIREFFFLSYENGSMPVHESYVTMSNFKTLFRALLSDCNELINSLAHLIGGRPEEEAEHGHPFADNVGYAMKYILLNDYTEGQHHVDQLKAIAGEPELEYLQGYAPVLQGIISLDKQLVNEGLTLQLNLHKQDPDHQGLPEELFSLQVLGLAKLAIRRGIDIVLDDPITPQALLQKHEVEYPSLVFLPTI